MEIVGVEKMEENNMGHRSIPAAGEFYRHFKGKLYQIIGIAKHSETMEQMVVYQALYGKFGLYVRPLEMFMSPVDKKRYPAVVQEYRFEKCVPGEENVNGAMQTEKIISDVKETVVQESNHETKNETAKQDSEETVREEILRFLDAEGAEEKLKVLRELRMDLDENILTTMELSLDLLPDDKESPERRYELVERTLEQRVRFEGGRLR